MTRWYRPAAPLLLAVLTACGAVPGTVPRGTTIPVAELRSKTNTLDDEVLRRLTSGDVAGAFYALEAQKSRSLAPLIAQRRVAPVGPASNITGLVALQQQGSADDARGLSLAPAAPLGALTQRRAQLEEAYWSELAISERRVGFTSTGEWSYELLLRGRYAPLALEELSRSQRADQATLSYLVTPRETWIFVARQTGFSATRAPAPTPEVRAAVVAMSVAVSSPKRSEWQAGSRKVYDLLIAPVAAQLGGVRTLTIVPHGFVANVPFAALVAPDGLPLLRRMTVSNLPAAGFYRSLLQRPLQRQAPRLLAVGNPEFPEPWQRLPLAEVEARTVAHVFGGSLALTGAGATEERIRDAYRSFNVLHFATHGMLGGELAPETSSLVLTPSRHSDGYLTAMEIADLRLEHTYLAVLSACETSVVADAPSTDLGSLSGAFLSAGAPSVIGSLWKVSDASTASLMVAFYREFLERGTAEALRQAQLGVMSDARTAHPYYWAPFALYGQDR